MLAPVPNWPAARISAWAAVRRCPTRRRLRLPPAREALAEPTHPLEQLLGRRLQLVRQHEPRERLERRLLGEGTGHHPRPCGVDDRVVVRERKDVGRRLEHRAVAGVVEARAWFDDVADVRVAPCDELGGRARGRRVVDDQDLDVVRSAAAATPGRGRGARSDPECTPPPSSTAGPMRRGRFRRAGRRRPNRDRAGGSPAAGRVRPGGAARVNRHPSSPATCSLTVVAGHRSPRIGTRTVPIGSPARRTTNHAKTYPSSPLTVVRPSARSMWTTFVGRYPSLGSGPPFHGPLLPRTAAVACAEPGDRMPTQATRRVRSGWTQRRLVACVTSAARRCCDALCCGPVRSGGRTSRRAGVRDGAPGQLDAFASRRGAGHRRVPHDRRRTASMGRVRPVRGPPVLRHQRLPDHRDPARRPARCGHHRATDRERARRVLLRGGRCGSCRSTSSS